MSDLCTCGQVHDTTLADRLFPIGAPPPALTSPRSAPRTWPGRAAESRLLLERAQQIADPLASEGPDAAQA